MNDTDNCKYCDECSEETSIICCCECGQEDEWCGNCNLDLWKEMDACHEGEVCLSCLYKIQAECVKKAKAIEITVRLIEYTCNDVIKGDEDESDTGHGYGHLGDLAISNALIQRNMYRGRHDLSYHDDDGDEEFGGDVINAIVNFLRHEATNYERILKAMSGEVGYTDEVYWIIRDRVHQRIAEMYPDIMGLYHDNKERVF